MDKMYTLLMICATNLLVIPNGPVCVNFGGTWTNFVLCLWIFPVESLTFCLEMRRLKFPFGVPLITCCCGIPGFLLSRCPNILVYCKRGSGVLDVWEPFIIVLNFILRPVYCWLYCWWPIRWCCWVIAWNGETVLFDKPVRGVAEMFVVSGRWRMCVMIVVVDGRGVCWRWCLWIIESFNITNNLFRKTFRNVIVGCVSWLAQYYE